MMKPTVLSFVLLALLLRESTLAQQPRCAGPDCDRTPTSAELGGDKTITVPAPTDLGTPANAVVDRKIKDQDGDRLSSADASRARQLPCHGAACAGVGAEEKTEFQKFIFANTGEKLEIFGKNLFDTTPSTFAPVDRIPVPAEYVIGPGDELLIKGWGQIDVNAKVTVDRDGQIYLPKVGAISVAGVRNDQLTTYLKAAVGRVFKNFDLNVTLGQLRSIQVLIVGQARQPGTYTISSLSTLVNALFASGGPSVNGSMRHIQLKRKGISFKEFDLYDLLINGDKSKDTPLLSGDVIYIPPVEKQVAIMGSVRVPGIYEIVGETTLRSQITMAGGLSTTADGSRVLLERIEEKKNRTAVELKLDEAGLAQILSDGDILRVFPISPQVDNSIVLRGHVAVPGRYPWHEGLRVSNVIPSRSAILTRDFWLRQNALARPEPSWPSPNVSADAWSDGTLADNRITIERAGAEVNWDYAVVQRLHYPDLTSELLAFNLGKAIDNAGSPDNLQLEPGDVITVFSQSDFAVPVAQRVKFVWVAGEVQSAGVYRVDPGETLRDVIARAGGLTSNAFLYATEFTRISTRIDQQRRLEKAADEMQLQLQARSTSLLNSARGNQEETVAAKEQIQAEQQVIERFRRLKATGRIVLDLKPDDSTVSALPEVVLEDGDTVTIPSRPATVAVIGAVYNQNSFLFRTGSVLREYLTQAGGPTREADRDRTFVIRADGSVVSAQMHRSIWSGGFDSLKLLPGDTAVVPGRIKTGSLLKSIRDWSQVFAQFAIGVAAIKVLTE
jgi:polysaccharide biosynthesis/export protein